MNDVSTSQRARSCDSEKRVHTGLIIDLVCFLAARQDTGKTATVASSFRLRARLVGEGKKWEVVARMVKGRWYFVKGRSFVRES